MAAEGFKRKLTTIFSADVVGYSRLMEDNEEATIQTLNTYRNSMSTLIEQHRGRVVDMTGDNLMAEFSSVVDAVKCAVETQKEISKQNAVLPENRGMLFRIGVNLGDIVEEGDRIYGDGVNIAARLEGLSEGGGICISGTAYDQLKNKLELGYEYLGEHRVKNIESPVRVYKVLMEPEAVGKIIGEKRKTKSWMTVTIAVVILIGLAGWSLYIQQTKRMEPASVEKMAFALPAKPSIAVMPFLNMTADPKQEFFADGLNEGIITALAKVPQLFVIGRDSTFSYKGKSVKANQVSEELGVQYVLEGSVQKGGDSVRITAQLIDAIKGHHLWAERYDRQLKDVFSVQDEITKKIITACHVQLTHGEWGRIASKGTENLDAYLKSQEAAWCADQDTRESLERGKMLSEEAIVLDPKFAHAYHVLGVLHMLEALSGFSKNPRDSLELAIKMQRKAIELDESFAMARAVMGFNLLMLRNYDEAISEAENAYQLMPGSSSVLYWYGTVLTNFGKAQEAVPILQKVLRLEPKPMNSRLRSLSAALRDSGQYEKAIAWLKKAIQKEPDSIVSYLILTSTYVYSGQEKEARAAAKEILRINPKFSIKQLMRANPQRDTAARERFVNALKQAGLPD
jgi:adenylate cyclase